ncbi:hypothetical protein LSH36_278g06049 [Paralvinella palmiformis]|uniref:G-protein coupled receptors family 1 profile domain-containing protein n=1 Tax=Paralvinella palmiformis TaxID=53620 RepID=A0AAD9JJW8_9ANNE|nr:hypothetical protein LSH36_278g06049 [Paralvinella palmiformis]
MELNDSTYYYTNLTPTGNGSPLDDDRDNVSLWNWAEQLLRNRSRPRDPDTFSLVLRMLKVYYTPSVVVFGLIGNTLIWFTLLWTKLRHLSCSHYLSSVMTVNTLYLMALLGQWLRMFGIDLYNTPGLCQFVSFVNNLCVFLSVWLVVGFAVDRYILSAYPASSLTLCSTLRAKVVIVSILLVGFVVYVNISLTVGVINVRGRLRCSPLPMFLRHLRVLTIIDMLVNIMLPYSTVIYVDVSLMWYDWEARHRRRRDREEEEEDEVECQNSDSAPTTYGEDPPPARSTTRRDTAWQVERIQRNQSYADTMHAPMRRFAVLFLTYFLLSHLPSELFRLIHTGRGLLDPLYDISKSEYYCQVMAQHLYNTSLATHIVLFSICHAGFRSELGPIGTSCTRILGRCLGPTKAELRWTDLPTIGCDPTNNSANSSNLSTSVTCV